MSKYAEKLIILLDYADCILCKLHDFKRTLLHGNTRPSLFRKEFEKLCKHFDAKFPEFKIQKISGFESFSEAKETLVHELRPYYNIFLDILEFKETSITLLLGVSQNMINMKTEWNPDLTRFFMGYFVKVTQALLLAGSIVERKAIVGAYNEAHRLATGEADRDYLRLARFIGESDRPVRMLQHALGGLADLVHGAIASVSDHVDRLLGDWADLPRLLACSPPASPDAPPEADEALRGLRHAAAHRLWVLYGFLVCPDALKTPAELELLRRALCDGFASPLCQDERCAIHSEYDAMLQGAKMVRVRLTHPRKFVSEALAQAVQQGPVHAARRTILLRLFRAITHGVAAQPAMLTAHTDRLLTLLALAKHEIMWYFAHLDRAPPKSKARHQPELFRGAEGVAELAYLLGRLASQLLAGHAAHIGPAYARLLHGPDREVLARLVADGDGVFGRLDAAVQRLLTGAAQALDPALLGTSGDSPPRVQCVRLDLLRVAAALSSTASTLQGAALFPLYQAMSRIVFHGELADRELFELSLFEHASLHELYGYAPKLYETMVHALASPSLTARPECCASLLRVPSAFLVGTHACLGGQHRAVLARDAVAWTHRMLGALARQVEMLLWLGTHACVALDNVSLDARVAAERALQRVAAKRQRANAPPPASLPQLPGHESQFGHREELMPHTALQIALVRHIACMIPRYTPGGPDGCVGVAPAVLALRVQDTLLYPLAYLVVSLARYLTSCLALLVARAAPEFPARRASSSGGPTPSSGSTVTATAAATASLSSLAVQPGPNPACRDAPFSPPPQMERTPPSEEEEEEEARSNPGPPAGTEGIDLASSSAASTASDRSAAGLDFPLALVSQSLRTARVPAPTPCALPDWWQPPYTLPPLPEGSDPRALDTTVRVFAAQGTPDDWPLPPSRALQAVRRTLSATKRLLHAACPDLPVDAVARRVLAHMTQPHAGSGSEEERGALEDALRSVCPDTAQPAFPAELTLSPPTAWVEYPFARGYLPRVYAQWFGDVFVPRVVERGGGLYSPQDLGFVTLDDRALFRAQDYASQGELRALGRVVGPAGLLFIRRALFARFVPPCVARVHAFLDANKVVWEETAVRVTDESALHDVVRRLKGNEATGFIQPLVELGVVLHLLRLLQRAAREAMQDDAPLLFAVLAGDAPPEPVTSARREEGEELGLTNTLLHSAATPVDPSLWSVLSAAFLAVLGCSAWRDATFVPTINGISGNLHVIPRSLVFLARVFHPPLTSAVTAAIGAESTPDAPRSRMQDPVATKLREFAQRCSAFLLKQSIRAQAPKELPLHLVFLDRFVEAAECISMPDYDEMLPHPLLRSTYIRLFRARDEGAGA